jgi:hypothetical protein
MMRYSFGLIILLLLLMPTLAQEATEEPFPAPLIAYVNGDLLQLENGALVPYTACTPDENLLGQFYPSPDGSRFVMLAWPKIISQALELFGSLGDIPYGQNFWLCDTKNDSLSRILVQPNADNDFAGELPSAEVNQSRPTWSPDGTKLAWTQLRFVDTQQSIVIMDIAAGTMIETVLALPPTPFPAPPEIHWTEKGLALFVFTLDEVTFANVEWLYLLDPATGAITHSFQTFVGGETSDFITDRVFVQQESGLALALHYFEAGWALVDLETGEQSLIAARLEMFSASNPYGLRLAYSLNEQFNYDWEILGGASPVPLLSYPMQRLALSPDGNQVAYADSVLHLYNVDGTIMDVANSDGFADDFAATIFWGQSEKALVAR